MNTFEIPKLARNKYNYVKGNDGQEYVTQTQITGGGSSFSTGGGNGSVDPSSHVQISSAINQALDQRGLGMGYTLISYEDAEAYFVSYDNLETVKTEINSYLNSYYVSQDELSTASYVTTTSLQSTLSNASYVTSSGLSAMGYINTNTLSQASYVTQQGLSAMSYATTTMVDEKLQDYATSEDVSAMIDATKSYADNKASSDSAAAKNASYYYTDTSVSGLRTDIVNTLSYFAWPCDVVKTDYTFGDMPVNTIRPVLINSSTTVNITVPGDSHQSFVILAFNVITSVLVSAGKNPHYIAVTGGTTTQITWTSTAEPFMLCFLIRTE